MTRSHAAFALVVAGSIAALGVACSSSTGGTPDAGADARASQDGGASDARGDRRAVDAGIAAPGFVAAEGGTPAVVDDANCAPPGTPSNAAGVGGYCSPNGGQCARTGREAGAAVCTADFNVPAHAWFCTIACTSSSDCGPGSVSCLASIEGQACIPAACAAAIGDLPDATSDAPTDASESHDAAVDAG